MEHEPYNNSVEPIQSIEPKKPELNDTEDKEAGEKPREYPFDGIIVFGHGWSEKSFFLTYEAKMRATAAYQLWKEGMAPKIILTGGPGSADNKKHYQDKGIEIKSNAEQMREMLIRKFRVPESAVEFENQSFRTVDNVAHALNVLAEKNLPRDNFITVSTGYHMDRISQIMKNFGLSSQPVSAEAGLNARARAHADRMKKSEVERAASLDENEKIAQKLTQPEIDRRWLRRAQQYASVVERIKLSNQTIRDELATEPRWQKAMENWAYWGPLALALKGDTLKKFVQDNRGEIESWLERKPDINVTIEDIMLGNFDYRELVKKGREVPSA